MTNTKCPVCGKRMLLVKGKNSEMLVCQDRECGHRETVARTSNARCPVCHKKMELRGKGDSQIFVCKCGYKEKLSSFKDRRAKEGAGVSKKDVAKYLNLGIFLFFTPQIVIKILPYLLGALVLVDSIWKIKGSYRLKKAQRGRLM